ncbi:lanthionine synthetase LanC family protein [Algoriphagus sp.]|jgi:hypothetical protein|uniref:lanthionine synthetase LanC family protein n=1 Tax=Algoriphagus sp. TaxID=1872435 RepID=UPI002715EE4E|nr:lanthionine synthetase LanC family protein [Algoriphagus sp.]MDO8965175.1 lanthionine synthetase LanC family protein [Algoriphagus sp.]MDP3201719.1 lanthionine synthetase LanC family protein [Algoriphagus sp.]
MEQALRKLQEINGYLLENAKEENGLGLLHGKLGLSIYFFHLARKTENQEFLEAAENLIEELFEKLKEAKLPVDFENGLAGIAWGISYLVNSDFVEADLDDTLGELDDRIFKFLEDQKGKLAANVRNGIIGYLLYCLDRLENSLKSGNTSNIYIFQKLGAGLINQLGQLVEEEKLQDREPQLFNIFWDLPLTLIVLGKSTKLQVNSAKAERILDYILPSLISLFPSLHSNRLYLLLGIESVLKEIENPFLRRHALFLKSNIDMKSIFNAEFKNLNICVIDGASGLRLIAKMLVEITGNDSFLPSDGLFLLKINESVCWGEADFYSSFRKSIGLVSGLPGIGWALLETLEVEKKI